MSAALDCLFVNQGLQSHIMTFGQKIGAKIRAIRRGKIPDMSEERLALDTSISRQALIAIEKGRTKVPRVDTLSKIAKALAVDLHALIGEDYELLQGVAEDQSDYHTIRGSAHSHQRQPRAPKSSASWLENNKRSRKLA